MREEERERKREKSEGDRVKKEVLYAKNLSVT